MTPADRPFFSLEEAFVRLGQNRQKGCLVALNRYEALHLFVDDGKVVGAFGPDQKGEPALAHALSLTDSSYLWLDGAERQTKNLEFNIQEYALQHSLSGEVKSQGAGVHAKTVSMTSKPADKITETASAYHFAAVSQTNFIKIKLFKSTMIVGRSNTCDVQFDEDERKISRRHCQIRVTEEGVFIRDLASKNGTFVNGQEIEEETRIGVGDLVNLGDHAFVLQCGDEEASKHAGMILNEVSSDVRAERKTSPFADMVSGKTPRTLGPLKKPHGRT